MFLQDEIFSSSFAAAMYLKVNNFPREKKVSYRVGSKALFFFPLDFVTWGGKETNCLASVQFKNGQSVLDDMYSRPCFFFEPRIYLKQPLYPEKMCILH